MSTRPTPDHLATLSARILGIMPRTRGQALDTAAEEVGMLIGELCESTEAADHLADQLVRHPWRRWSFAEFRTVAERLAIAPKIPTEAELHRELVPAIMDEAEYQGLRRLAIKLRGPGLPEQGPNILAAEADARDLAAAEFDRLRPKSRARLMELCRDEFTKRMALQSGINQERPCRPPFLDRNARDLAEQRIYRRLVCGESEYYVVVSPAPAPAADPLAQAVQDAAHKKHL